MLSAAIRVLARTAAIQLEEVAAAHAVHRSVKGKERETPIGTEFPRSHLDSIPQRSSSDQAKLVNRDGTEDSPEAKEVEAKIQRLLRRVKQSPRAELDRNESIASAKTTRPASGYTPPLPHSAPVPPHKSEAVPETKSAGSSKLPDSSLVPDTIQPSTPSSSPTSTPKDASAPETSALPDTQAPILPLPTLDTGATSPNSVVEATHTRQSGESPASDPSTFPPVEPISPAAKAVSMNDADTEETPVMLRASKVPSSRIGRLFHYGSLAASLSLGAASESIRRTTGGGGQGSVFMSDANVRRLVATLGRMRGAALKLGQFMSIQDNHMLPPEIEKVLQQVQAHANYMPDWQMEKVMSDELGSNWRSLFSSFDQIPFASASIGQVHRATLAGSETPVAVKIQFPGIAGSINSDLANLSILIRSSALLPKGLYLQNTIAVMRRELEDECDYIREAASGRRFHDHLKDDDFFVVPKVIDEATTGKVLTTEWMSGKPLSRMKDMSQETRDKIGTNILRLCLQELFQFRFMQTDPNWANFLYDAQHGKLQLIDFGASREYTKEFMDGWYRLLKAALEGDREIMRVESLNLGYLTGEENEEMLKAHLDSMALIASPFSHPGKYAFAQQTITDSVRALIPIMLKHRLTPPPPETYSLNRKLSGAFLMCARLGANVDCRKLWEENVGGYTEG